MVVMNGVKDRENNLPGSAVPLITIYCLIFMHTFNVEVILVQLSRRPAEVNITRRYGVYSLETILMASETLEIGRMFISGNV